MAKKPDTPCTGCGKLLWSGGNGSLPAGQRKCRDCRRSSRAAPQPKPILAVCTCIGCGTQFVPHVHGQRRCKKGCSKQGSRAVRNCEICGHTYRPTHGGQRTCGRACGWMLRQRSWPASSVHFPVCFACGVLFAARRVDARYCSTQCRRVGNAAQIAERYHSNPVHRDDVLARAHARRADKLGLGSARIALAYLIARDASRCGICRDLVRERRGPMGPSIDHIVPLSLGGRHELVNVQLAHYRCNLRKYNSGTGDQMLLFG